MVGPLFDEPGAFDRDGLALKLRELASRNIYIGGSSWKYEGWLDRSTAASAIFRAAVFRRSCSKPNAFAEYAEVFPTVCGDFAFYQFPTAEFWSRLFRQAPENFRFAFKVPEQITCKVFPTHPRYGAMAGTENEAFLDAGIFQEMFVRPLLPHREKTALLIFEFGAFGRRSFPSLTSF